MFLISALAMWLGGGVAQAGWQPAQSAIKPYNKGIDAQYMDDLEVSLRQLSKAAEKDPECGMCQHALAISRYRLGELDVALGHAQKAVELAPNEPDSWVVLSTVQFAAQDFEPAWESAEAALELDAGHAAAVDAALLVLLRVGDDARAAAVVDAAAPVLGQAATACLRVRLGHGLEDQEMIDANLGECRKHDDPSAVAAAEAMAAGSAGELAALAQAASQLGAGSTVQIAQAVYLYNDGEVQAACDVLDQVLDRTPEHVDARRNRALCRYSLGDAEGARRDLETAFRDGTWIEVHESGSITGVLTARQETLLATSLDNAAALLVQLYVESGRLDEAEAWLARAVSERGPSASFAAVEALVRHARGDDAGAWERLAAAVDENADAWGVREVAGRLAVEAPAGLASAPQVEAMLASSETWQARYNLAIGHSNARRFPECVAAVESALPVAPLEDQGVLWAVAHACAVGAGDLGRADTAWTKVRDTDGWDVSARFNHALARAQAGDHAGAIALLEGFQVDDPALAERIEDLRVYALFSGGQLDAALAAGVGGAGDAGVLYNLFVSYWNADEIDKAIQAHGLACGGNDVGDELGEMCDQAQQNIDAYRSSSP